MNKKERAARLFPLDIYVPEHNQGTNYNYYICGLISLGVEDTCFVPKPLPTNNRLIFPL